jgi:DNA-binding LacI/PurR family transcriptional regulator
MSELATTITGAAVAGAAVTIKDVARESGVNISTVSRALNDGYGIHPETREHILAVASRLRYRPNRVARGLATGRSHSVALLISDIRNPFFAEVARGAEDAARAAGCDMVLCNSDLDADKQMQYVNSLLEKRVDGILMNSVASLNRRQQRQLVECGVPIVLLNRSAANNASNLFPTVCADNEGGGALAARYLLKLGHTRIAHITGPRLHGNMTGRANGFVTVLKASGLTPELLYGEHNFGGGYALTRTLLDSRSKVTAIFAASDAMAFGAVRAIMERGLRIPEDISLIGFDNVELCSVIHPPLTTIHQPKHEIGQAAMELLLRLAGHPGKGTPEHRILGVELVERQSCQRRKK